MALLGAEVVRHGVGGLSQIPYGSFAGKAAAPKTLYVSQSATNGYSVGSDSYTYAQAQSKSTPFLTVDKAINSVVSGDTIIVNDGTYDASITTYHNIDLPLTLSPENDWMVTLTASNANRVVYIRQAAGGVSLGNIWLNGEGSTLYGVETDLGASVDGIDINGVKVKDTTRAYIDGNTSTNIEIQNWYYENLALADGGLALMHFEPSAAGYIRVHDGEYLVTSNLGGTTKEIMLCLPSVDGVDFEYYNVNVALTSTTTSDVWECAWISGCETVLMHDITYAISGLLNVSGWQVFNHATIVCDSLEIYNITGDLGGTTGYLGKTGDETNTNRDKITGALVHNNSLSGGNHGFMFGWITGAKGWGNKASNCVIGFLQKGTTNCYMYSNLATGIAANGSAFRFKGATGCIFANNTHVQSIAGNVRSEYSTYDDVSVTNTTGSKFVNGITLDNTGGNSVRLAEADANSAAGTTWENCDYYTTSTYTAPFKVATTNYATVALFNASAYATGCVDLNPIILNPGVNFKIDATSPVATLGVDWWTAVSVVPLDYDGASYPSSNIKLGAYQTFGVPAPVFAGTIPDISHIENTGTHSYDLSTYFTGATSYSIAPAVETGWSFNTTTAELVIDTDDASTFGPYIVTGTNLSGSDASNAFGVAVTSAAEEGATGGWWFAYDYEYEARKRKKKELEELEAKAEEIQDDIDRELAKELRKQDRERERIEELKRLSRLADAHKEELQQSVSQKAILAAESAMIKGSYSAMERLERELRKAKEEEEFLIQATSIILNS